MTVAELKQALALLGPEMDRKHVCIAFGAQGHHVHCGPVLNAVIAQPGLVLFPFPFPPPDGAGMGPQPEDPADWWKKG